MTPPKKHQTQSKQKKSAAAVASRTSVVKRMLKPVTGKTAAAVPTISSETAQQDKQRAYDKLSKPLQVYVKKLTLGGIADALFDKREERLKLQKQAEEIELVEKALRARLIAELPKSNSSGIAGRHHRATVFTEPVPQVEDRDKFNKYVLKSGDLSLLEGRVSTKAIKERWEAGKVVPGIGTFNVVKVSVEKLK